MILVNFPSGGSVVDVVNNQTNHHSGTFHEERKSVLDYRATAFNVYVCLNQSWRYEHNQYEGVMKNQDIRGNFFQNLGNFHI